MLIIKRFSITNLIDYHTCFFITIIIIIMIVLSRAQKKKKNTPSPFFSFFLFFEPKGIFFNEWERKKLERPNLVKGSFISIFHSSSSNYYVLRPPRSIVVIDQPTNKPPTVLSVFFATNTSCVGLSHTYDVNTAKSAFPFDFPALFMWMWVGWGLGWEECKNNHLLAIHRFESRSGWVAFIPNCR